MNCLICMENLTNEIIYLNCTCNYSYHTKCINKWLNISFKCPICKKKFSQKKSVNIELKRALFFDSINKYNTFRFLSR